MIDPFREAMARVAGAVAIIAAPFDAGFRGLTASSLVAASLEPPLVLVCLDRLSTTRDAVVRAGVFGASVLTSRQRFLAERFAGRAPSVDPAWREVPHRVGESGAPLVESALAWFECSVVAVHQAGDHDAVVGEVIRAGYGRGDPLLLWDRGLWTVSNP
jgi:3-hydroxy-9,10-secoandrosta-1,3,5(10)-triene-9,17-dione monooxygenase reductase component